MVMPTSAIVAEQEVHIRNVAGNKTVQCRDRDLRGHKSCRAMLQVLVACVIQAADRQVEMIGPRRQKRDRQEQKQRAA